MAWLRITTNHGRVNDEPSIPNPWLLLPERAPFVLPEDAAGVNRFIGWARQRADRKRKHEIQTQIRPDPFIGLPDAPVVIILANPGYTDEQRAATIHGCERGDDWWHENSTVLRDCYAANYRHEAQPYPMFFLDPRLAASPGGVYYRQTFLRRLRERFDEERLAHALTLVEFYPYHSRSWAWSSSFAVPSQAYSHHIVRSAIVRGATIVVMRCRTFLERSLPELAGVDYVMSASRSPAMSPGNLVSRHTRQKDGFERIVAAIRRAT